MIDHHRCHRGPRCANWQRHPDTGARAGAPINADVGLCDGCTRRLAAVLGELPRAYVDLERALSRAVQPGQDIVTGTRDLPIPVRADVEAVMAEMTHEALCWAESVSEVLGIVLDTQQARDSRPGPVLDRCSRILVASVPVLLALHDVDHVGRDRDTPETTRDGVDGAGVFLDLHYRVRGITGQTRLINRLPVPCPRCEYLALERHDGSETITCAACARAYTWDEYSRLCTILADRRGVAA